MTSQAQKRLHPQAVPIQIQILLRVQTNIMTAVENFSRTMAEPQTAVRAAVRTITTPAAPLSKARRAEGISAKTAR